LSQCTKFSNLEDEVNCGEILKLFKHVQFSATHSCYADVNIEADQLERFPPLFEEPRTVFLFCFLCSFVSKFPRLQAGYYTIMLRKIGSGKP
jgi:hypothetical protein